MARQIINTGAGADTIKVAFGKANANFAELFQLYTLQDETSAYISGLVTSLSNIQILKIDNFVKALKTGLGITNISDFFDALYLRANETQEVALRNIAKNAHHATAVNSPSFTALEGFTSNGTSSYINTNCNLATQGVNYTLNSGSIFAYSRTENTTSGVGFGVRDATNFTHIYPYLAGNMGHRINQISTEPPIGNPTVTTLGLVLLTRVSNTEISSYRNKTKYTQAAASGAIPNGNLYEHCRNSEGTASLFINRQLSISGVCSGVTDAQANIITDAIEAYMDSIGKGVIA